MIKYLLDTNICIYLLKQQFPAVAKRFGEHRKGEIAISAITWAELCCGLNLHNSQEQLAALTEQIEVCPFDASAAAVFGELSQKFPNRKSSFDRLIAAHAVALKAVVVTNNVADFELYGLPVENWVQPD